MTDSLLYAQWREDWVKVPSELAQDRRAWSSSVRDVANSVGYAGSTRPGECRYEHK